MEALRIGDWLADPEANELRRGAETVRIEPKAMELLMALAAHAGHEGWVIAGYSPAVIDGQAACHTCGTPHARGDVLYRPVFERGRGPEALPSLPTEGWLDCLACVEGARRVEAANHHHR